ncbi:putative phage tail protein [Sporosarcina sp. FSL K6-2383]|uniref:putative phage tail protein n=1 Tax=Sporosarcina sp. FSL K6-2383 TaxID=2921556 RepID=UPI00315A8CDF
MTDLLEYLPEFYHDIREFRVIAEVEGEQFDELDAELDNILNDQFIMTAREPSIVRRERTFKIQADLTIETLDFRRKRIINRQSIRPPFTERYLQDRFDFLLGKGVSTVNVDVDNFILSVSLAINDAAMFKEVLITIEKIVPLNMIYLQKTAINDSMGIKESIVAHKLSRNLRLGTTWRLGVTPFAVSTNEVTLK